MLQKLKYWAVEQIFRREFEAYDMPFKRLDDAILKMSDAERAGYLLGARTLLENKTLNMELEEAMRRFYKELSLKTGNTAEIQSYRLTIKFIGDLKKRLGFLAASYKEPRMPSNLKK